MSLNILVTGGTGSFGQEFVKQLLERSSDPDDRIAILSRDEQKQEQMATRFRNDGRLRFFLGDVRDKDRLKLAVRGMDTVVHAAALKIVPALEYNPVEAVKTNIIGTQNLIEAIHEANYTSPTTMLALSTDKAVSPVNLYGSTKLCMEKLVLAANNIDLNYHKFSVVRYGNVAGSRGSVIPKFRELLAKGSDTHALPVTDERMTRFWITLPDAVKFVIDRLVDMEGAEVFIPNMRSFRVVDIAHAMAKGHPGGRWRITGIRPGEKLHESIISEDEYADGVFDKSRGCYIIKRGHHHNDVFLPLSGGISSEHRKMTLEEVEQCVRTLSQ